MVKRVGPIAAVDDGIENLHFAFLAIGRGVNLNFRFGSNGRRSLLRNGRSLRIPPVHRTGS